MILNNVINLWLQMIKLIINVQATIAVKHRKFRLLPHWNIILLNISMCFRLAFCCILRKAVATAPISVFTCIAIQNFVSIIVLCLFRFLCYGCLCSCLHHCLRLYMWLYLCVRTYIHMYLCSHLYAWMCLYADACTCLPVLK